MKYRVTYTYPVFVTVEIEADNEEEAIDAGYEDAGLTSYVGNGGFDKLVGVSAPNVSVEAGDSPIDDASYPVTVEESE